MRQIQPNPIFSLLFALLLVSNTIHPSVLFAAGEKGLQMKEGTWIFDVRIQMPLQSEPTERRLKTCVTDEPITAEDLMPWAESQGCRIRSVKASENELTWKLKCKINGQRSRGRGSFQVDGDKGQGKTTINLEVGGRRLSIVTEWDAQHAGACVDPPSTPSES